MKGEKTMSKEFFMNYVLPVLMTALTALAGFIGTQVKQLYQRWVNDRTKEAVVRTCVKAVEQLYHDLGGPEKLEKAKAGAVEMLVAKGISITELELNMLIESVVSEFNHGFGESKVILGKTKPAPVLLDLKNAEKSEEEPVYSEEGGSQ